MEDSELKTERVVWDGEKPIPVYHSHHKGKFIRGPIPIEWLAKVLDIPGTRAIRTALFLLYEHGLQGSPTEILASNIGADRFRLTRWSKSRGLHQLEKAGLIRICSRKPGRSLRAELLGYGLRYEPPKTH